MKRSLLIVGCLLVAFSSFATHIAGGELIYERIGPGAAPNFDRYRITMRLFRPCSSGGQDLETESVRVGIYDNPSLLIVDSLKLEKNFGTTAPIIQNDPNFNACLSGNDKLSCFNFGTWSAEIELPRTAGGYYLVWARYTRRTGIENVNSGTNTGATFITQIPGTNVLPNGFNSSPKFIISDTTIICKGTNFTLDYSSSDPDSDSLSYRFAIAYDGFAGSSLNPNPFFDARGGPTVPVPPPPSQMQLIPLTYIFPYTPTSPLGSNVTINQKTGIVSGIAPVVAGQYVVCVIVEEWRDGVKINEHRKDFILKIGDCSLAKPDLGPDERTCNGFDFTFTNNTTGQITSYLWNFGDNATSSNPQPSHTYATSGLYTVQLKITASGGCQDSATKQVYVFPGFVPNFTITGSCYLNPYQFNNTTFTAFGVVDTTKWNFGDPNTLADTSNLPNPTYKYPSTGTYPVFLYATNSKGCRKDTTINLVVLDKPLIQIPFKDTLICSVDTLILLANANGGTYTWTPNSPSIIQNPNIQNPKVYPKDTTVFVVSVFNNGCVNKDSIKVNVLDFIDVNAGLDTTICQTDTIRLNPISDALNYVWTASTGETVDPTKYPLVKPLVSTLYNVKGNLGKCQDRDSVFVKVVPYPKVSVTGSNLCYGKTVQLNATITGSSFSWSPTTNIINANTLTPTVNPLSSTVYTLSVMDTLGCTKTVSDTASIVVIPPVTAYAGKDTAVVASQPLQMFVVTNAASLSPVTTFNWLPSLGLNNNAIQNPVATLSTNIDSIKYVVTVTTADGCIGQDDIVVKIFSTDPDIFVPTAFTPNADGKNDILRPICVGISKLDFFRVYNRWGQMIFETKELEKGWDGKVGGTDQDTGTYVFMAQGTDYTGKVIFRKGTVVLIR